MADLRFPLHWPDGWPRTRNRKRAPYKVTEERALTEMLHSLKLLGATNVQLSTNLELRLDGRPYATQKRLQEDPGAAVYFRHANRDQVIACDRWDHLGDNYRAIGLAVEALRQLARCGATELLDRAFLGFAALPAATSPASWRLELRLPDGPLTREQVENAYRGRAVACHPDHAGGSHEAMVRLNAARDAALAEVSRG